MKRTLVVELDEYGAVCIKRRGYHSDEPGYSRQVDILHVPDFAGAITKEPYLNELAAREVYEAITQVIEFVLGHEMTTRTYWDSFEVEFMDGQTTEEERAAEGRSY